MMMMAVAVAGALVRAEEAASPAFLHVSTVHTVCRDDNPA